MKAKANELRKKSVQDLTKELLALLKEQFNLRIQKGAGQPPKPHLFKKVRLAIARIKTILHEKGSNV
jgi:large subunit ribosomal protein L29